MSDDARLAGRVEEALRQIADRARERERKAWCDHQAALHILQAADQALAVHLMETKRPCRP